MLIAVAVTAVSVVTAQLRCVDAAGVAARAAARGAPDAAALALRVAPPGAAVTVRAKGELLRVTVRAQVRPFGSGLPAIAVGGEAVALNEVGVP